MILQSTPSPNGWTSQEVVSAVINGFAALGTLAAVFVALWGDRWKLRLWPVKLAIELSEDPGTWTWSEAAPVTAPKVFGREPQKARLFYRHLRVVNTGKSVAHRCRVLLSAMYERNENGVWVRLPMPVPFQMPWAPAGGVPSEIDIQHQQALDFGMLVLPPMLEGYHAYFQPALYAYPNNFNGFIQRAGAMRYELELHSAELDRPLSYTFEVEWDGQTSDLGNMADRLRIRRLARVGELSAGEATT